MRYIHGTLVSQIISVKKQPGLNYCSQCLWDSFWKNGIIVTCCSSTCTMNTRGLNHKMVFYQSITLRSKVLKLGTRILIRMRM